MHSVPSSDGVAVALHDLGGDGRPLLLVHANGFHGRVFASFASRLGPHFHCLAPDLRGHGSTTTPEGAALAWDRFGDDVAAVAAAVAGGEVGALVGFGHSLGGAALLMAEARRPGTFAGLYLYEPIVLPESSNPATTTNPLAEGAVRRREVFESTQAALENYASKPPLDALHPDALRAYVEYGFEPLADGTVRLRCRAADEAAIFTLSTAQRVWELLPDVSCGVVVGTGRADGDGGPAAWASRIAARLPAGRLERFETLGHFGPLEDPDALAASVLAALT